MSDYLQLGLVNRDAEEALIGALIIDPDQLNTLDITKDDFYLTACSEIFEAIRALRHDRKEIDFITIREHLNAASKMADVGGDAYLLKAIQTLQSSQNAQSYAAIITDLASRRSAYRKAQEFVQGICKKDKPIDQTISEFSTQLPRLIRIKGGLTHISQFASKHYDRMDRIDQGIEETTHYLTGVHGYDDSTNGGLIAGELMILSGQPGMGKTKLMLQMAAGIAKTAVVGVYEMETDEDEIMDREISRSGRIPTSHFLPGGMTEEDWPVYTHVIEAYGNKSYGFYIDFTPRWSLAGLRADLSRAKCQFGLNVFMIDYMKFISDRYGKDDVERLNYISGELKLICRELNLAGVVIHAMNKEGAKSSTPDVTSIAMGMDIVYDADKVCLLNKHTPEEGPSMPDMRTFVFLKSRRRLERNYFHLKAVKDYPELGEVAYQPNAQNPGRRS